MNALNFLAAVSLVLFGIALQAQQQPQQLQLSAETKPLLVNFEQTETSLESQNTACTDCGMTGMASTAATVHYPTTNTCIKIFSDGSYTYDRVEDRSSKPKIKVYQGTLAAPELAKLQSILDDGEFKKMASPSTELEQPYDAKNVTEGEAVTATVVRGDGPVQMLTLLKRHYSTTNGGGMDRFVTNWDKLQKPLKPFLSFMKDLDKRGQSNGKAGDSSCQMTTSPF